MLNAFGILTTETTQASLFVSRAFQIRTSVKANAIIYSCKDLSCYMKSRKLGTHPDAFISGWLAVPSGLQRLRVSRSPLGRRSYQFIVSPATICYSLP